MSIGGIGSTRDFVLRCLFLLQWKHTSSIVDLTDDDGPPKWGLAKITAVLDKEEFDLHWFGTYSKAKSLASAGFGSGFGKSPGRTFGYLLFCAVFYVGSPVAVLYV